MTDLFCYFDNKNDTIEPITTLSLISSHHQIVSRLPHCVMYSNEKRGPIFAQDYRES